MLHKMALFRTHAKFRRSCCIVVFGLITLLGIGCEDQKDLSGTLRLEVNTRNTQPLRQALHGFNTNMITGDYGYLDPNFVELTKALAPKTLRFPGGTVGNFYHWEVGGFFENEMTSNEIKEITSNFKSGGMERFFSTTLCSYAIR